MNPRERSLAVLTFGAADKVPFEPGGGRESTLKRWHAEGLPEGVSPVAHAAGLLGIELERASKPGVPGGLGVDFRMRPIFEEKIIEHRNGHYVCQDWKGNICEISDTFGVEYLRNAKDFVTRRWIKCPVENRDDWAQMKERYHVGAPGRFPDDFAERCVRMRDRDWMLWVNFSGPFWQLREWCGFEGLCMLMIEDPEFVAEMAEFWKDFVSSLLDRILEQVVPDAIHISEDMAYKAKAMISPVMAREFCMPSWIEWTSKVRTAGCPVVDIDSDGYIGELIPLWIESGVNVCDPIEVAAHCDINKFRAEFGHKMAYRGGVDKRCIAKGGQALRDEIRRIEPVVKDGGYIPGCDHAIPGDVSWSNFLEYCRLLAEVTGWL